MRNHCSSCHSVQSPTQPAAIASSDLQTAYQEAKQRLDYTNPSQSKLLIRSTNGHCGEGLSECRLSSSVLGPPIQEWAQAELTAESSLGSASTLRRSSALTLANRLKKLFPTFDTQKILNGVGLGASLGQADFDLHYTSNLSTSALAIGHLRSEIASLCNDPSNLFSSTDVLLAGETLPPEISKRQALLSARNVWGFPYQVTDLEVSELTSLYSGIEGDSPTLARKAVCMATLLAPQFWLGNPGQQDLVRRMAMDVGGRFPTFQEYAQFESGSLNPALYFELLSQESGYRSTVAHWHQNWLGTKDFSKFYKENTDFRQRLQTDGQTLSSDADDNTSYRPAAMGVMSQGIGLKQVPNIPLMVIGPPPQESLFNSFFSDSEQCNGPLDQAFDPVTTKVEWQVRLNSSAPWQTVGSWVLETTPVRRWVHTPGSVTTSTGVQINTDLNDITFNEEVASSNPKRWRYLNDSSATSKLAGTDFGEFLKENRRVLRYGSNGQLQNGYSKVRLWWSGQEVYACNTGTRFIASCAYRPLMTTFTPTEGGLPPGGRTRLQDGLPLDPWLAWLQEKSMTRLHFFGTGYQKADWTRLTKPEVLIGLISDGYTWVKDSIYHPHVIESFSCGIPKPNETSEVLAYPKIAPYNTLAVNLRGGWYGPDGSNSAWFLQPEGLVQKKIHEDLALEPKRLVEHILESGKDYRQLLTADYTLGSRGLELLYHTQGYWLPTYPAGIIHTPGSSSWNLNEVVQIQSSNIQRIPKNWFRNAMHPDENMRSLFRFNSDETDLHPRTFSGILTMPAFLAPGGFKVRSLSARIFRTLTCGEMNGFAPNPEQKAVHQKYVPTQEPGGANHASQSSCLGCHINLDPLGAALSNDFISTSGTTVTLKESTQGGPGGKPGGELLPYAFRPQNTGFTYGIRSRSNRISAGGAVLGTEITGGIRQVGSVIANSELFARCSVTKAFEGLFGRAPATLEEQTLVEETATKFMDDFDYNYTKMVKALVLSPAYQREN